MVREHVAQLRPRRPDQKKMDHAKERAMTESVIRDRISCNGQIGCQLFAEARTKNADDDSRDFRPRHTCWNINIDARIQLTEHSAQSATDGQKGQPCSRWPAEPSLKQSVAFSKTAARHMIAIPKIKGWSSTELFPCYRTRADLIGPICSIGGG